MTIHSAIAAFLDQGLAEVAVSSLSCLSSALNDIDVACSLVEQNRHVCCEMMSKLVAVANDGCKNLNARVMALECLYLLSNVPSREFHTGDLLDAVQKLNESFEEFLKTESDDGVNLQHEMLTVLLFRCSGYTQLKAGDLLQQLYGNDDVRLVATLLAITKNRTLEWDILHACVRCMYELTTPVSYFFSSADDDDNNNNNNNNDNDDDDGCDNNNNNKNRKKKSIEVTKVTAFQDKITVLLVHILQQNVLQEFFNEISTRWALAVRDGTLLSVIEGETKVTDTVRDGVAMNFLTVFRYMAVMLLNVADFCSLMEAVRTYHQSFMAQHQSFIAGTLISFVRLALRCWQATYEGKQNKSQSDSFLNVVTVLLRLLRFIFYKSSTTPQESLVYSLLTLTQHIHSLKQWLSADHMGMLVLVLTVELLCNINATNIPTLATEYESFIVDISKDKTPCPEAHLTVAQAFAYCLLNESSTYWVQENESVKLLQQKLHAEKADTVCCDAAFVMQALNEQLGVLQLLMTELAVGQFLSDLCFFVPFTSTSNTGKESTCREHNQMSLSPSLKSDSLDVQEKKTLRSKKLKHPHKYLCMLTNKLMREPVVLSNGHHFELEALQEVVDRVGHVDPLNGEVFNDELQVDMSLQQEIAQYRIEMAACKKS